MTDSGSTTPEAPLPGTPDSSNAATLPETLADLGEWELIRRLGAFAPAGQFADDAALLPLAAVADPGAASGSLPCVAQRDLVINTDVLVEGIHFSDTTTAAADVGWRATAANLSDLAAMGCTQGIGITVGLVAPASTPWSWVEGVYQGIDEALRAHGGVLLGGDCSSGAQRLLAITALGRLPAAGGPIRRGDGRPGDRLVSTGPHGLSRLGLALLQGELPRRERFDVEPGALARAPLADRQAEGEPRSSPRTQQPQLPDALMRRAIQAHRRPVPRFDAVRALIASRPAAASWRVGGCDSSDGLAAAAAAIAQASGCSARLERLQLPLDSAMATLPQAKAWGLGGGEDFELVLAVEPAWAKALVAALPGASLIGRLEAGTAGDLGWTDGCPWDEGGATGSGFRHFG